MPPLGMLFAWMVLGAHVEVRDLLGIIPVALGIYLVTRPRRGVAGKPIPQREHIMSLTITLIGGSHRAD